MSRLERSIDIAAERMAIWREIADLSAVAVWNPNVLAAECDYGEPGIGTGRRCALHRGRIEEVVSGWEPGRELWFAIGNHGGIRSAEMGMVLTSTERGTTVTAIADYHLALGPIGPVVDRLAMRRSMERMIDASLEGLKQHIEEQPEHIESNTKGTTP